MASLNRLQQQNLLCSVCDMIINGYSRTDIINSVQNSYTFLNTSFCEKLYAEARESIKDKAATELESVVDLHVSWYEKIWQKFSDINYVAGKNAALKQKEKILGLLKDENVINIKNEFNVSIVKKAEYDLSKLDAQERKRLDDYFKRVRVK